MFVYKTQTNKSKDQNNFIKIVIVLDNNNERWEGSTYDTWEGRTDNSITATSKGVNTPMCPAEETCLSPFQPSSYFSASINDLELLPIEMALLLPAPCLRNSFYLFSFITGPLVLSWCDASHHEDAIWRWLSTSTGRNSAEDTKCFASETHVETGAVWLDQRTCSSLLFFGTCLEPWREPAGCLEDASGVCIPVSGVRGWPHLPTSRSPVFM